MQEFCGSTREYGECTALPHSLTTLLHRFLSVVCVRKKTSGHHEMDPSESASTYGHSRPLHDVMDDVCDVRVVKRADDVEKCRVMFSAVFGRLWNELMKSSWEELPSKRLSVLRRRKRREFGFYSSFLSISFIPFLPPFLAD